VEGEYRRAAGFEGVEEGAGDRVAIAGETPNPAPKPSFANASRPSRTASSYSPRVASRFAMVASPSALSCKNFSTISLASFLASRLARTSSRSTGNFFAFGGVWKAFVIASRFAAIAPLSAFDRSCTTFAPNKLTEAAGLAELSDLPQLPGAYDCPLEVVLCALGAANCDGEATGAVGAGAAAYAGVEGAESLPQLPSPHDLPLEVVLCALGAANCDDAATGAAGAGAAAYAGVEGAESLPQLPSPHDLPLEVVLCALGAENCDGAPTGAAGAGAAANVATAGAAGARATGADEPSLLQLPSPHDWPPEVEL